MDSQTLILRGEVQASRAWMLLKNWKAALAAGKPLAVTIATAKSKRNTEQNALYWATLQQIADTVWLDGKQFSRDTWHEHYRRLFLPFIDGPTGLRYPVSTTTLSVSEFSDYVTKILADASSMGVEFKA